MVTEQAQPWVGFWLIRGVLIGIVFLMIAGSACRQAPNVFLFGSMNNTRLTSHPAAARWAEPVEAQGLPNLYQVSDNLYRGARPTTEGIQHLRMLGIRTVVNLEQSNGEQTRVTGAGLAYEHIPMTALFLHDDDVAHFLRVVGDLANAPIFVHCKRGADRTGLMCAVYRIAVQGWTKDDALAEMTQGGFRFNYGYQNIVNYIRDLDVDQLRERAALTPKLSLNPTLN
jgi:protein tyrosine/serine phosphatase